MSAAENYDVTLLAEWAHTYALNGVAIFPVAPRGKLPLIGRCDLAKDAAGAWLRGDDLASHAATCPQHGHGFYDATDDPETIRRWWDDTPDANIGISLGANGIWVLDVDGPSGATKLRELEAQHGALSPTYEVVTGREEGGGKHRLYRQPADGRIVRNGKPWGLKEKLEVKGAGGYVLAPPSIHPSGRAYLASGKWSQIAEADDWLLAICLQEDKTERPRAPRKPYDSTVGPDGTAYGKAALDGELDYVSDTFADGNRHHPGLESSGRVASLINGGELPETAAQVWVNEAIRCGMPEDEAVNMMKGALGKGWSRTPPPLPEQTPRLVDAPAPAEGWTEADDGTPVEQLDPLSRWIESIREQAKDGRTFLSGSSGPIPALWGEHGTDDVLWAEGEGLLVVGPPGVGKTTLVQQVVAGRLGHPRYAQVLGHPVKVCEKLLYLALDRPRQIGRSLNRMLDLAGSYMDRLVVWDTHLPFDPATDRHALSQMCAALGVDTVVVDSLYDLSPSIVDPKTAGEVVNALKVCVNDGIDLVAIHHPRKQPTGTRSTGKPHLDDLYGGMQLGAGFGSVLYVTGEAGDQQVNLHHLKQPGSVVGPLVVVHDHDAGVSTAEPQPDVMDLVSRTGRVTAADAAMHLYDETNKAAVEKARRRLEGLVRKGLLVSSGGARSGVPTVYLQAGPNLIGQVPL